MAVREANHLVRERIELPVKYDGGKQTIRDSQGMIVCDIKGWIELDIDKTEDSHYAIGEKVAKLLNESGAYQKEDSFRESEVG